MGKVLVTGANRGIGLELCRQLVSRGDEVIAVCRKAGDELQSLSLRVIEGIDVSDTESINSLAVTMGGEKLDWLINNAGILSVETLDSLNIKAMEQQFRVNSLGPLQVTAALLKNLPGGSKVGIVTSRMGSIDDNNSGGYYGYRMSKAAVNMAGKSLSRDLEGRGVAVALLHPGMVSTDMTGGRGVPVEQSAGGLIQRMDALDMSNTGSFWHAEGEDLPW
ncbi:MAG: SDR family oxidoreductase [Xanthomonadales bacterium]|nr:SDR family oxidoreductase [Xanthomonadales bacterium]MDH4019625.1 SDR family oxidoreductase [Xanthomonadales bacterium]